MRWLLYRCWHSQRVTVTATLFSSGQIVCEGSVVGFQHEYQQGHSTL